MKLKDSFIYASKGIRYMIIYEEKFILYMIISGIVVFIANYFDYPNMNSLFIVIGLVYISEMFNTAIEELCNIIDESFNHSIMIIKNISAGAVLISMIVSIMIGFDLLSWLMIK